MRLVENIIIVFIKAIIAIMKVSVFIATVIPALPYITYIRIRDRYKIVKLDDYLLYNMKTYLLLKYKNLPFDISVTYSKNKNSEVVSTYCISSGLNLYGDTIHRICKGNYKMILDELSF